MKKTMLILSLIFLALATNAIASSRDITVNWEMSTRSDVLGFRMYYSYNSEMINKMIACETNDQYASTLTCNGISLDQSPVYVTIAAILAEAELTSAPKEQTFTLDISTVSDFKIYTQTTNIDNTINTDKKLSWLFTSDTIDMPSNKVANRAGNGVYISSGCYDGGCYDNIGTNSYISIPVINNDIIDPNNFQISLYFNPKSFGNYQYIFSVASDINNAHKVHVYEDGSIYCRTVVNGHQYYTYLDTPPLTTGQWYKLTYIFSSNQITISLNDTLAATLEVPDTFEGKISEIRLANSATDGYSFDCLLDNLTIQ